MSIDGFNATVQLILDLFAMFGLAAFATICLYAILWITRPLREMNYPRRRRGVRRGKR